VKKWGKLPLPQIGFLLYNLLGFPVKRPDLTFIFPSKVKIGEKGVFFPSDG